MNKKLKNLADALVFVEPEQIPFIIWNTAPFCCDFVGIKQSEYYLNAEIKTNVHIKVQKEFPESVLFPGIWPDFGAALEPSMFGCEIIWHKDQPPNNKHIIEDYKDILRVRFDPKCSLLPIMIKQYKYMWGNTGDDYISENGFLDGVGFLLGPLETSAVMMTYTNFLLGLYDQPGLMHTLLDMVTDGLLYSLNEQQKVNGKLRKIFMCDHMSHQISRQLFDEYCYPYYKRIFDEFPSAIKLYHNEGNLMHIADRIPDMGADIIHYGANTKLLKDILNQKVVMMGNLNTIDVMLNGNEDSVYDMAIKCLIDGAEGGGFLLSTAGGIAPGTPIGNIKAAIKATEDFRYNIRNQSKNTEIKKQEASRSDR